MSWIRIDYIFAVITVALVISIAVQVVHSRMDQVDPIIRSCEAQNYTGTTTVDGQQYDCECWDPSEICEYTGEPPNMLFVAAVAVAVMILASLLIRIAHPSGWCRRCNEYHYRRDTS